MVIENALDIKSKLFFPSFHHVFSMLVGVIETVWKTHGLKLSLMAYSQVLSTSCLCIFVDENVSLHCYCMHCMYSKLGKYTFHFWKTTCKVLISQSFACIVCFLVLVNPSSLKYCKTLNLIYRSARLSILSLLPLFVKLTCSLVC